MGNTGSSRPTNRTGKRVVSQKIENAKKTNVLSLTEHSLDEIPVGVFRLTSLRTLDLSKNKLKNLRGNGGESLSHLTELKTLNCEGNILTAGALAPVSGLSKLQALSLGENRLGAGGGGGSAAAFPLLPKSIKRLDLRANALTVVPRPVCHPSLRNLERLDLSANRLAAILPEIGDLVSLTELNLDDNTLVSLPPELGRARKLKTLSLRNNQISATVSVTGFSEKNPQPIPASVFSETLLIDLNLHGNRGLTQGALNEFEGFDAFLERRRGVKTKNLHGGAMTDMGMCGLD